MFIGRCDICNMQVFEEEHAGKFKKVGGVCPDCGKVFCYKHFNFDDMFKCCGTCLQGIKDNIVDEGVYYVK